MSTWRASLRGLGTIALAGCLLASTADAQTRPPASACTSDVQGANDEPGQKDLTQFCLGGPEGVFELVTKWSWDTTGFGGANTGDACSLYDTDADGLANVAVCVTIRATPAQQAAVSPRLYTCADDSPDRCTSSVLVAGPYGTVCQVSQQNDQPFAAGDDAPADTEALCGVDLADFGAIAAGGAALLDACSYPSQQPNSDPSDCIVTVECKVDADCTDANVCSVDVCRNSVCVHAPAASNTVCRAAAGVCDEAETCTGEDTVCPEDDLAAQGTECRASTGVCDVAETCTGSSPACPDDELVAGDTECRAAAGDCDVAETCTGTSGACPADDVVAQGTTCRPQDGICDVAEVCDGSNTACPADAFAPSTTTCRESGGVCDPAEQCSGSSGACPADGKSTAVCRASAGVCDVAESCDGVANDCPADGYAPSTTTCRESAGACDVADQCSGSSAACPTDAKSTAVCRASAGVCDVAESCDGSSNDCPANGFAPSTTTCRESAGACDVADQCTGSSAECGTDVKSTAVCRASAGECDIPESCDGVANACPDNGFAAASVVCRAAADDCDMPDNCTGSAAACPADASQPDGTSCAGDEFACTTDACRAGACEATPDDTRCDDEEVCTSDVCAPGDPDATASGCVNETDLGGDETCSTAVCRTAGFWSTHAAQAGKKGSTIPNLTQSVIDYGGCLNVCGEAIDDTALNSASSALEATCVPVKGDSRLQLVRQLTATALNCIVTNGSSDCANVAGVEEIFAQCNAGCAAGATTAMVGGETVDCIAALDCFNNGGELLAGGLCKLGTCGGDPTRPCGAGTACGTDSLGSPVLCVPTPGNCHEAPLANEDRSFEPAGPATSEKLCNDASKSRCTLIQPGEGQCAGGTDGVCAL